MSSQMPVPASIRIKNLSLRASVGIKAEEHKYPQDVLINAEMHCDISDAVRCNRIDETLNYRTVCKELIAFAEGEHFELLENMTYRALDLVMSHPQVLQAWVEIDKVAALRYSESVSIALSGVRDSVGDPWRCLAPSQQG